MEQGAKAVELGGNFEDLCIPVIMAKFPDYTLIKNENFNLNKDGKFLIKGYIFPVKVKSFIDIDGIEISSGKGQRKIPDFTALIVENKKIIKVVSIIEVRTKISRGSDSEKYLYLPFKVEEIITENKEISSECVPIFIFGGLLDIQNYEKLFPILKDKVDKPAARNEIHKTLHSFFESRKMFCKNSEVIYINEIRGF